MSIGQQLLDVPMGDMIRDMAFAIADSQFQLDQGSMRTAEMMGGLQPVYDDKGNVSFDDSRVFFGYEYMTIKEALAYAIFDDSLSGALDEDSIKLKETVIDIIKETHNIAIDKDTDGQVELDSEKEKLTVRVPIRRSMMELGFSPTFYQFVDTIIEVKIAINFTRSSEYSSSRSTTRTNSSGGQSRSRSGLFQSIFGSRRAGSRYNRQVNTTQVDASYSSKYSYSAEGASLLRTKLAPVPPPAILEERIRTYMDIEAEERELRLEAQRAQLGLIPPQPNEE